MKVIPVRKSNERGTALLVALFLCLVLSISIAGYMKHAQQQNRFSVRSQSWNLSVAVSEAGVEEGLQQLNSNTGNLTADGWAQNGSVYRVTRSLNSATRYTVYLDMSSPTAPVITAQSFIDMPTVASINSVSPIFAAANMNLSMASNTVSRAVRVRAGRSGLFLKAMVAKHLIDMKYSIHFHVWSAPELLELVQALRRIVQFELELFLRNGMESLIILRKPS